MIVYFSCVLFSVIFHQLSNILSLSLSGFSLWTLFLTSFVPNIYYSDEEREFFSYIFLIRNYGDQNKVKYIFKVLKNKRLYLENIFFRNKGVTKTFSDEEKLVEFIVKKLALKEMQMEVL